MKWLILILILAPLVYGEEFRVDFDIGKNYVIEDKNITLTRISKDSVVFCVNGVENIVEEDDYNIINDVRIEVLSIKTNSVSTKLGYRCSGCECNEECDNSVCFDMEKDVDVVIEEDEGVDDEEIIIVEPEGETISEEDVIEPPKISTGVIIAVLLVLVVVVLGLIVLWKKV